MVMRYFEAPADKFYIPEPPRGPPVYVRSWSRACALRDETATRTMCSKPVLRNREESRNPREIRNAAPEKTMDNYPSAFSSN